MYSGGPPPAAYLASLKAAEATSKPAVDPSTLPEAVNKTGGIQTDDGRSSGNKFRGPKRFVGFSKGWYLPHKVRVSMSLSQLTT